MQVITPGHKYALQGFEHPEQAQIIQFIEKEPDPHGGDELITIHDGTTNEELLAVLIDRMQHLQAKFPCRENAVATTHLETALMWLEKRTADRKKRGVEGQHKA